MDFHTINKLRKNYHQKDKIIENSLPDSPHILFKNWFETATKNSQFYEEPNAMVLSTINSDLEPNSRVVLLKSYDEKKMTFYTNYESRKSKDIRSKPSVSSLFYWPRLARQIIIKGSIVKGDPDEANQYFATRSRESQIAAWASKQSSVLNSHEDLLKRYEKYKEKFEGQKVLRPNFWGNYDILPTSYEFWQGQKDRMHDRILYTREGKSWKKERRSP